MYSTIEGAGEERLRKDTSIRVRRAQGRTESITSLAQHIEDSSTVLCAHRGHFSNYTFTDITQAYDRMHTRTTTPPLITIPLPLPPLPSFLMKCECKSAMLCWVEVIRGIKGDIKEQYSLLIRCHTISFWVVHMCLSRAKCVDGDRDNS